MNTSMSSAGNMTVASWKTSCWNNRLLENSKHSIPIAYSYESLLLVTSAQPKEMRSLDNAGRELFQLEPPNFGPSKTNLPQMCGYYGENTSLDVTLKMNLPSTKHMTAYA